MDLPDVVLLVQMKVTAGCRKLLFPHFCWPDWLAWPFPGPFSPVCSQHTQNRPQSPPSTAPRKAKPLHYSDDATFRDVTRLFSKKVPMCPPTAIKVTPATHRDIKHTRELTLDSLAYRFMERHGCLGFGTVPGSKVQRHKEVEFD